MEILKMRFSILHTFQQISRNFHFPGDLDLFDDLDLRLKVTKNVAALSFDIRTEIITV